MDHQFRSASARSIAKARVNLTGGVVLKGLEVRADGVPKSAERVFAIERAEADLNWWSMLA
ncbi:MAG: hypothetical protein AAF747_03200, partial [Planctomycetota bacterium]